MHAVGVAAVPFSDLPVELQKKHEQARQSAIAERKAAPILIERSSPTPSPHASVAPSATPAKPRANPQADPRAVVLPAPKDPLVEYSKTIEALLAQITQRPPIKRTVPIAAVRGGSWIEETSSDGSIIKLADGSIWRVSYMDQINTALWLPITDVTVIEGDDPSFPYKIINKDDGEVANVRLLSR
jgi:hypothetical protein